MNQDPSTVERWRKAFDLAMRAIALYGDHWAECARENGKPCDCHFSKVRREIREAVPR